MDKITFQDATLKTQGYVTINGTNYEIIDSVYENGTELNAAIFNTLQNNIETAINKVDAKSISYVTSTQLSEGVTPTEDCYIELFASASGWGTGGAKIEFTINNTEGNAELINSITNGTQGHENVPDGLFAMSVYKLLKNTTYKFIASKLSGGTIYSGMIGKIIPFI